MPDSNQDDSTVADSAERLMDWSVAIVCTESLDVEACVGRLQTADRHTVRLFVRSNTVVPVTCRDLAITCLSDRLPPSALDRLVMAEQLMRRPQCDGILLVFGSGAETVLRRLQPASVSTQCMSVIEHASDGEAVAIAIPLSLARDFLGDEPTPARTDDSRPGVALLSWADRHGVERCRLSTAPSVIGNRGSSDDVEATNISIPDVVGANSRITVHGADVSVVVPTWNCGAYLKRCLDSLLNQTIVAEVIVVNDGSTDETTDVLREFESRVTVVRHARRSGANAARNTGISAARGEFIAFADADNEYSPLWIQKLLDATLADPQAAYAYCAYSKLLPDGATTRNPGAPWDIDVLWYANYIDMSSVIRRSELPADGLHTGFRPFDDWRLWLRLAEQGWRGAWVPDELFVKHVRASSKTAQSMADPSERARDVAAVRRQFAGLVGLEQPISVVIPACGCEELTARCLTHLSRFCGVPFRVAYVDNGSARDSPATIAEIAERLDVSLQIIRNTKNLGFTHAVNQGLGASGNSDVLVLNNDCFVGPNCVENLARELRFGERVAATGPLTGDDGRQSLKNEDRRLLTGVPDDILETLDDPVATSSRLKQRRRVHPEPVLSFFCVMLSGEAIDRFGPLDTRFESGLAADDEWCLRVRAGGWRNRLVLNAYATHLHRTTFNRLAIDRDALQRDAKVLLDEVLASGFGGN